MYQIVLSKVYCQSHHLKPARYRNSDEGDWRICSGSPPPAAVVSAVPEIMRSTSTKSAILFRISRALFVSRSIVSCMIMGPDQRSIHVTLQGPDIAHLSHHDTRAGCKYRHPHFHHACDVELSASSHSRSLPLHRWPCKSNESRGDLLQPR